MLDQNYDNGRLFWIKVLAIIEVSDDIVAVRHDLPHMPSLGVSSLDSRPPWRHGGLLFCRYFLGKVRVEHAEGGRLIYPDQVPAAACARNS
jgi:hypothetical protein